MNDPVIACFKAEFERFFALVEKQIEVCPDELWKKKAGGFLFWQQILHSLACIELFASPAGAAPQQLYKREVIMFSEEPQTPVSKKEMHEFAAKMHSLADAFFASMSVDTLTLKNESMSQRLNKELTNQNALMALVRHTCYHLGCCDAALRDHGVPGVF